ncbi:MAG: hypothetical protein AAF316_09850 [Cyanobacteria bacterium P01_A01_bin.80]
MGTRPEIRHLRVDSRQGHRVTAYRVESVKLSRISPIQIVFKTEREVG